MVVDNLVTGARENVPPGAEFIEASVSDPDAYGRLPSEGVEAVFHLGAQSSGEVSHQDPLRDFEFNAMGTMMLLQWCGRKGIERFLHASSMAVYGPSEAPLREEQSLRPHSYYAASKQAAEAYVNLYGNLGGRTTILRMFNVYGPGQNLSNLQQGMISIYMAYLLRGEPILVKGTFDRYRDQVFVEDVVDVWLSSLEEPLSYGKTYNVGTGRKATVREVVDGLIRAFGYEDYPVVRAEGTPGDIKGSVADISAVRRDLGWEPKVELEEGLRRMAAWARRRNGTLESLREDV